MTHDATLLRGTLAFGAGKFGNCLTSGVLGTSGTAWDAATATLETWVRTTASGTKVAVGNEGSGGNGWWIGMNGSTAAVGDPTAIRNTSKVINDGAWHHLALVVTPGGGHFYVDGVESATTTYTSLTMGAGTNAIGGFGMNGSYDWVGSVDEVRVSSVARYASSFSPPASAFTADSNTLALYHLEADGSDSSTPPPPSPFYADAELNFMADLRASRIGYLSMHTASPGATGANEATGGSPAYARKAVTFNAAGSAGPLGSTAQPATVGRAWSTQVTFDMPPGTYTHFGAWSSDGVFRGGNNLAEGTLNFDTQISKFTTSLWV